MQLGIGRGHTTITTVLLPLLLIAAGACVGAVTLPLLRAVLARSRRVIRARRERGTPDGAAPTAESRARALMSELCPHGWHAQITLLEGRMPGQPAEPESGGGPVAIDWVALGPGGAEAAVTRRVWAQSIDAALEAMVADRRTDVTLEQIELRATADGAHWPDA